MLLKLSIDNYALIHQLEMDFGPGLSVITGETGAGKSILVGALSLILGQRADTGVLTDETRKCVVEGTFSIAGYHLESFFRENDLDYDKTTILRREISPNGKSRAFINDTPVNINVLKDLGDKLVNIHSQHSIITLNDSDFQLAVVDSYAGQQKEVSEFRAMYREYRKARAELEHLKQADSKTKEDTGYQNYLLDELEKACLTDGEQEELERRLEVLTHAEEIKSALRKSIHLFAGEETNILTMMADSVSSLSALSGYFEDIKPIIERIRSNQIDIKDILSDIQHLEQGVSYDPEEAEKVSARLDLLYRLEKKHKVTGVGELITIKQSIENKLTESSDLEEKIKRIEAEIGRAEEDLLKVAGSLSVKRKECIPHFEKEILKILVNLGMPNSQFHIELSAMDFPADEGSDQVRFLFSANRGTEMNDLAKIASGGELSRVMLAIKSMINLKNLLPTVIFDEIDNGVSGDIAGKVGKILRSMAGNMQVIVITHLPQIAGKGDTHYWVFKKDERDTTRSMIKKLNHAERVEEIAKMLSNETVSDAAFQAARELLKN